MRRTYRTCCGCGTKIKKVGRDTKSGLRPLSVQRVPLHTLDQSNPSRSDVGMKEAGMTMSAAQAANNCSFLSSLDQSHYHLQLLDAVANSSVESHANEMKLDVGGASNGASSHFCSLSRASELMPAQNGDHVTGEFDCAHLTQSQFKYSTLPTLLLSNQPSATTNPNGADAGHDPAATLAAYGSCCAQTLVYNPAAGIYQPLSGNLTSGGTDPSGHSMFATLTNAGPQTQQQSTQHEQQHQQQQQSLGHNRINVPQSHHLLPSGHIPNNGRCLHPEPPEQLLFTFETGQPAMAAAASNECNATVEGELLLESESSNSRIPLLLCVGLLCAYVMAGAFVLQQGSQRSWVDALYECFLVLSTIGGPGADTLLADLHQQLTTNRTLLATGSPLSIPAGASSFSGTSSPTSGPTSSSNSHSNSPTGVAFRTTDSAATAAITTSADGPSQRVLLAFSAYLVCGLLLLATCGHLLQRHILIRNCRKSSDSDRSFEENDYSHSNQMTYRHQKEVPPAHSTNRTRLSDLDDDFDL